MPEFDRKKKPNQISTTQSDNEIKAKQFLEVVSDEYCIKILRRLGKTPTSCRELVETTNISKPTIYRRINKLKDIGVVKQKTKICQKGHHRSEYVLAPIEAKLNIDDHITLEKVSRLNS